MAVFGREQLASWLKLDLWSVPKRCSEDYPTDAQRYPESITP
jgi:hypothetical protein